MPLINVFNTLVVVGFPLFLVNRFIPCRTHQVDIQRVVVIGVVLWLMNVFGIFHSLSRVRVG